MSIATESFRIEPVRQRIRALFAGETVLDTQDARLVFEPKRIPSYLFPKSALNPALLEESGPGKWSLRLGDRVAEGAITAYAGSDDPAHQDLVSIKWDAIDNWFEEDEEVFVHPKNPYHRVDAYPSSRHVEVFADGVKVADSHHPVVVYETDMPPRYYLPKVDVRMDLLAKVEKQTGCPYKGFASYYALDSGKKLHKMRVWEYATPFPEAGRIAGHLAFYQEKLDVRVDGQPV